MPNSSEQLLFVIRTVNCWVRATAWQTSSLQHVLQLAYSSKDPKLAANLELLQHSNHGHCLTPTSMSTNQLTGHDRTIPGIEQVPLIVDTQPSNRPHAFSWHHQTTIRHHASPWAVSGIKDYCQLQHRAHSTYTGKSRTQSNGTELNYPADSSNQQASNSSRQDAQGILVHLPASMQPYAQLMRLDKPAGTWLLLWPSIWSIALAAQPGQLPDFRMLALFSVGALLLRGAGCTINDLWDRKLDAKVERTRTRPLASGALQPWQAVACLAVQLSLGLCILLQLNTYSQLLGASSLLLVCTYPLMKRVTYWPQAYLGLTFNWGALLGWAAVRGACDWGVVLPLYGAGLCWTLVYDTIYAHQDKKDDVVAGVKSTALLFGSNTKPILAGFAALQLAGLTAAGMAADIGPAYYIGVLGMGAHLAYQLASVNLDNGTQCASTFASNKWAGAVLAAGCVAGRLMQ